MTQQLVRTGLMADQQSATGGNGSGDTGSEPQVSILAQYIKDLSVENPSAPQVFQWQVQPTLDVQFNINVEKAADDVHEVTLKIEVAARSDNGVHFVVDLSYACLFGLRNVREEALPPLLLDPLDFAAAYLAQAQAAQEQAAAGEAGGNGGGGEPAPSEA